MMSCQGAYSKHAESVILINFSLASFVNSKQNDVDCQTECSPLHSSLIAKSPVTQTSADGKMKAVFYGSDCLRLQH